MGGKTHDHRHEWTNRAVTSELALSTFGMEAEALDEHGVLTTAYAHPSEVKAPTLHRGQTVGVKKVAVSSGQCIA
ncbi:MAG: hypothetical protein QOE61_1081 [Micromonosporaceae bacterium]|nr:hypothetical protein [Micromonosporaceae bacterium]